MKINSSLEVTGTVEANSFVKKNGTSAQFLKADGSVDTTSYLPVAGGTLTGVLTLKGNQYYASSSAYGMNANNSDIIGVNSIYTQDLADTTAEGIRFYRDATHWDSFTISGGVIYFMPNDTVAGTALSSANIVLHSGNYSTYAIPKTLTSAKGDIIYASAANTPTRLAIGTEGQVLKVGSGGVPVWSSDTNTNQTVKGNGTAFGANDAIDIVGSGAVTVTADTTNKKITISAPSVTDTNQKVKTSSVTFGDNDVVEIKAGSNITVTGDASAKTITIAGTANTATAADDILDGSNTGTEIKYAPYSSQQSKLSFDTSTTAPTRTDRLNLNGYLYATKLYSNNKEVLTDHQSVKTLDTTATTAQSTSSSETITGSGTIKLHKVAKTGTYSDLIGKPTIPATNVIPTTTTANKVLLSTSVGGTAAWSAWSTAGFLETDTSGVVSVSTIIRKGTTSGDTNAYIPNLVLGAPDAAGKTYIQNYVPSGQLPKNQTFYLPFMDSGDGGILATQYWVEAKGYTTNTGTVTSIATSGTGLSGGTITTSGTITLDSSSAGNAAANKVVLRNAAGTIQSEKYAVSSGTTTKMTMQYNATEDCIDFVFA